MASTSQPLITWDGDDKLEVNLQYNDPFLYINSTYDGGDGVDTLSLYAPNDNFVDFHPPI